METTTSFDLNRALQQWRAGLQNLGGFCAQDLEELEGHLRESISVLRAGGLSEQEAFTIATRRLGSERQLSDEFAKANPQRLWTERALWMVAGVLITYVLSTVARTFSNLVLNCALRAGISGLWVAAADSLALAVIWVGAVALGYWVLRRRSAWRDRVVAACVQRPVLTGLGLFIGLESMQYLMPRALSLAEPVINLFGAPQVGISPRTIALLQSWALWGGYLRELLWVAAVPLLAGYAWRKGTRSAVSAAPASAELQPGEDEAARALQGRGLSLDEASLVLARRRCSQAAAISSAGAAFHRPIWLERAVWMVAGVALTRCLDYFVLNPAWIPTAAARPAAPLLQHLAGLSSVCLGVTLAGAIVIGLWRWITRHPAQSASIGSFCRLRPLLAALALVGVCVGIAGCEYLLYTRVARPANLSFGTIGSQWLQYGSVLTNLLIPIALLLWLARRCRWRGMQPNPAPCPWRG